MTRFKFENVGDTVLSWGEDVPLAPAKPSTPAAPAADTFGATAPRSLYEVVVGTIPELTSVAFTQLEATGDIEAAKALFARAEAYVDENYSQLLNIATYNGSDRSVLGILPSVKSALGKEWRSDPRYALLMNPKTNPRAAGYQASKVGLTADMPLYKYHEAALREDNPEGSAVLGAFFSGARERAAQVAHAQASAVSRNPDGTQNKQLYQAAFEAALPAAMSAAVQNANDSAAIYDAVKPVLGSDLLTGLGTRLPALVRQTAGLPFRADRAWVLETVGNAVKGQGAGGADRFAQLAPRLAEAVQEGAGAGQGAESSYRTSVSILKALMTGKDQNVTSESIERGLQRFRDMRGLTDEVHSVVQERTRQAGGVAPTADQIDKYARLVIQLDSGQPPDGSLASTVQKWRAVSLNIDATPSPAIPGAAVPVSPGDASTAEDPGLGVVKDAIIQAVHQASFTLASAAEDNAETTLLNQGGVIGRALYSLAPEAGFTRADADNAGKLLLASMLQAPGEFKLSSAPERVRAVLGLATAAPAASAAPVAAPASPQAAAAERLAAPQNMTPIQLVLNAARAAGLDQALPKAGDGSIDTAKIDQWADTGKNSERAPTVDLGFLAGLTKAAELGAWDYRLGHAEYNRVFDTARKYIAPMIASLGADNSALVRTLAAMPYREALTAEGVSKAVAAARAQRDQLVQTNGATLTLAGDHANALWDRYFEHVAEAVVFRMQSVVGSASEQTPEVAQRPFSALYPERRFGVVSGAGDTVVRERGPELPATTPEKLATAFALGALATLGGTDTKGISGALVAEAFSPAYKKAIEPGLVLPAYKSSSDLYGQVRTAAEKFALSFSPAATSAAPAAPAAPVALPPPVAAAMGVAGLDPASPEAAKAHRYLEVARDRIGSVKMTDAFRQLFASPDRLAQPFGLTPDVAMREVTREYVRATSTGGSVGDVALRNVYKTLGAESRKMSAEVQKAKADAARELIDYRAAVKAKASGAGGLAIPQTGDEDEE